MYAIRRSANAQVEVEVRIVQNRLLLTLTKSEEMAHIVTNKRRPNPEDLTGLDLLKEICEFEGAKYIGSAAAGYATYDSKNDRLVILADSESQIQYPSIDELLFETPMKVAKQLGASFTIYRNQVICTIRGISKAGDSYSEATLRAILAYNQKNNI